MNLHFTEAAESHFFQIVSGYDRIDVNLANDFGEAVFKRLDDILAFPEACPLFLKNVRKANLGRFPYQLFYEVRNNELWVLAIWHNKREPGSWKKRRYRN